MPPHAGCPTDEQIEAYAEQNRLLVDSRVLDHHFAACRSCLDRYLDLGRRSLAPEVPGCRIVREIGRGRFGVVYKAWWLGESPQLVALKVLSCPGEMEQSRFDREIAVLRKLDSPRIVKYIDSGRTGDAVFYAMDYVEGMHLDEYFSAYGVELDDKLAVFERVCRAVADAHAAGVVHRDLKPRNILIDAAAEPHILDFGICSIEMVEESEWTNCTITNPGDVVGTLRYMSPEQAWGGVAGVVDGRSDIWSLGIMLHEIVTGGLYPYSLEPTPDKMVHEALLERIRKELPRLPRLDEVPRGRDLETLLERCLAWEPDRRLDSAAVLAEDLSRYRGGLRVKTKPPHLFYRIRRVAIGAATRSRWSVAAACLALVSVILWTVVFSFTVGWRVYRGYPAPSGEVASVGRDAMLVIGIDDETVRRVPALAAQQSLAGVTADVTTWRSLHGRLMERLATATPRAVVWDYYFRSPREEDAALVAGITKLEEAGVPVVLASLTYKPDGTPDLSPGITGPLGSRLRHGAIVARDMVKTPGEFVLAVNGRARGLIPSVALTTLGAVLHPRTRLDLDWIGRSKSIDLLHEIRPGAYLRERGRVELTKVFSTDRAHGAILPGDLVACTKFDLQRPTHWAARTISYQYALTCSPGELAQAVKDKLVVVGDFRAPGLGYAGDRHSVKYGADVVDNVPGCYLLAEAISGLIEGRYVQWAFPLSPTTFLGCLLLAIAGWAASIRLATITSLEPAHHRSLLWIALFTLSASCLLVAILTNSFAAVHVGLAGFSLFVSMAGSFWVEFARNRHRVADRKRRAIESFGLGIEPEEAGLTLPRKRPRSLLEAG